MRRMIKKWLPAAALAATVLGLCPVGASAEGIYKWRDKDGRLHFTDSEFKIPEEYRSGAARVTAAPAVSAPAVSEPPRQNAGPGRPEARPEKGFTVPYAAREGTAERVIVRMTFNGRTTVPILVDTGSPGLVISADLAETLGLFNKDGSNLLVAVSGIGGSTTAIRTIVDKIQIGSATEEFIPAHIVTHMSDAYQGLVGMDLLSRYTLTIDSAGHRLIFRENPSSEQWPAGRSRNWWQSNFREFQFYFDFWDKQLQMVGDSGSPYGRYPTSHRNELRDFIAQQHRQADHLLERLDRYARRHSVPRHWRH